MNDTKTLPYTDMEKVDDTTTRDPDHVSKCLSEVESAINAGEPLLDALKLPEEETRNKLWFTETTIRNAFLRKVYSILMVQLLTSAALIALMKFNPSISELVSHRGLILLTGVAATVIVIVMGCCETLRRVPPMNYISLFVFTLIQSFLLGLICICLQSNEILIALGICAIICFVLTVYAFQTKYDFTTWTMGLLIVLVMVLVYTVLFMFCPPSRVQNTVYCAVGILIFSIYLIHHTHYLIGGKHKYSISPEEYIFAVLNLYLNVIQIFLLILRGGY